MTIPYPKVMDVRLALKRLIFIFPIDVYFQIYKTSASFSYIAAEFAPKLNSGDCCALLNLYLELFGYQIFNRHLILIFLKVVSH